MNLDQRSSSDTVDEGLARINAALGTWKARMRQAFRLPSDPPANRAEAKAEMRRIGLGGDSREAASRGDAS